MLELKKLNMMKGLDENMMHVILSVVCHLQLQYMDGTDLVDPPEFQKRSLIAVMAYYHDLARQKGRRFSPTEMEKADFDEHRCR